MAIDATKLYEALVSFTSADGPIGKGDVLLGSHNAVANHEPLWILVGSTEAERDAAARAAGYKGQG